MAEQAAARPRMLVVDDEPENVALMRRMFRNRYAVEVAGSGTEALSKLEQGRYDVIITDQMMPGMTGTELLTQSLALAPSAVRILVTGFPDLATAISSINDGRAYRFFTKPLDRSELVDAVERALEQHRAADDYRRQLDALAADNARLQAASAALEARIEDEVQLRVTAIRAELDDLRARKPYDDASGLLNRATLEGRLRDEIARSQRFGLLCSFALLQITNLAACGSADEAIDRVGALLRLSLRRFDIPGRWGHDTFAIVMPHTDQKGAEACLARLHSALGNYAVGEDEVALALTGAIAAFPISGSAVEDLVSEAETALASAS